MSLTTPSEVCLVGQQLHAAACGGPSTDRRFAGDALGFGLPLVPHALSS